jgi:hypothetical protein
LGEGPLFKPELRRLHKVFAGPEQSNPTKAQIPNLAWAQTFQLNLGSESRSHCVGRTAVGWLNHVIAGTKAVDWIVPHPDPPVFPIQ